MSGEPAGTAVGSPGSLAVNASELVAQWISTVLAPPVCAVLGVVLAAAQVDGPGSWPTVAAYLSLAVLAPTGYVVHLYRRGRIGDLHLNRRGERIRPLAAAVAGSLGGLALVAVSSPPGTLHPVALAQATQTALFLIATTRWKVSAHTTAAAALAVLAGRLFGLAALPLIAWLPLVAWARIRLQRHTPCQVAAGAALGTSVWALFLAC